MLCVAGGPEECLTTSQGITGRTSPLLPDHGSGHNGPNFIAFRITESDGQLLDGTRRARAGKPRLPLSLGDVYHKQAPTSEFKKVPGNYREIAISDAVPKTMIELIQAVFPYRPDLSQA